MFTKRACLLLLLPLAGGCRYYYQDGHGHGHVHASPGGIYDGSVKLDGAPAARVVGAVSETGEGRFVDEDGRAYVAFVPDREFFEGSITLHDRGGRASGPFQGAIDEGYTLDGDFHTHDAAGGWSRDGSLALDNDFLLYDLPPHPDDLGGSWATGDGTAAFTFDPDGTVFGQDAAGCTYYGEVYSADPGTTLYGLDLERGCGGRIERWHGLASPTVAFPRDAIFVSVSGAGDVFAAVLFR